MKIIKYILIYSFIITLNNLLFANSFKVISRQGEASVIVNEEHADIDVKKSFPDDYFSISTKEESYLVMDNGEKSIILMPSSKLTYESNNFTLHSGYMYIKSKHNDDIQMTITKDERGYDFKGKSFAVVAYDDKISVITYNNAVKITPSSSLGVSYFLEPNHKTSIIPILDGPYRTTENEKSLIESVSRQLEMEVASHLNEDIDRYNFKIMEGTKNENTIYRVVHPEKGPNIFLIVPHGSERVGTDVAMERINMPIKKGSLTIVPIAVPEAYRKNTRAIEGQDINNRFFDKKVSRTDTDKLAKEYMKMLD